MTTRQNLITALQNHVPFNAYEAAMRQKTIDFVQSTPACFERSNVAGHMVAGALVLNAAHTHVALMFHTKLQRWLQPGGHADGDANLLRVAQKEVWEETGLATTLTPLGTKVFDVDTHVIPARSDAHQNIPEHWHYEVRYLLEALNEKDLQANAESQGLKWVALADIAHYTTEESVLRMVERLKNEILRFVL
jgi:8-oxo-dGTP pyrophosphatase MutT (NUDIX family)